MKLRRRKRIELQNLVEEAKRDVEPYEQWRMAKMKEWDEKGWDDREEEGHHFIQLETSSAEYRAKWDKMGELEKRRSEAHTAQIRAKLELGFAEEVLKVARTEDLAPIVERDALIRRTQKEVRFAVSCRGEERVEKSVKFDVGSA